MSDSIKKEADKLLNIENPNLYESNKDRFMDFINDHNNWYIVVFCVLFIFFIMHLLDIPVLNFIPIKDDTVKNLINSRTNNIVTMISVTFAIIGFLIANLAIKESFTYNLLFKKSTFFPVAFIALSLIASFIVLSTFSDWWSIDYQSDTLLVGTYLILIVIFLIGYLFTKLVRFTNQKYILDLVEKELISESKKNLLMIGRKVISLNKITELGFYQYSMAFLIKMTKGEFVLPNDHNVISDIKIKKLRKISEKIVGKPKVFVKDIFLYREVVPNSEDGFFYLDENDYPQLKDEIKELNNCIITSKKGDQIHTEAKEYVLQKLQENISSNDEKLVESYLNMLFEMYKLQQNFKI